MSQLRMVSIPESSHQPQTGRGAPAFEVPADKTCWKACEILGTVNMEADAFLVMILAFYLTDVVYLS